MMATTIVWCVQGELICLRLKLLEIMAVAYKFKLVILLKTWLLQPRKLSMLLLTTLKKTVQKSQ